VTEFVAQSSDPSEFVFLGRNYDLGTPSNLIRAHWLHIKALAAPAIETLLVQNDGSVSMATTVLYDLLVRRH
jgi:hypothetical protein